MKPRARSVYFSRFMKLPLFGLLRTPNRCARSIGYAKSSAVLDTRQEKPHHQTADPSGVREKICGGRPHPTEGGGRDSYRNASARPSGFAAAAQPIIAANVLRSPQKFRPAGAS